MVPGVKMVGMAEVGQWAPISLVGWQSLIAGVSACVIFVLHQKIQKIANKDTTFGYHSMGALACLHQQEVGKPSRNTAQPCAVAHCYVNDDIRAQGLWKG